jgi:alkylglycerol monooxygenase
VPSSHVRFETNILFLNQKIGRNRYCIDKNYGGLLIIWDRIFGTFAPERHYISYGLTKNIETFDPLTIQMHHYFSIYERLIKTDGILNKLSILFKGPGWEPGKSRLGNIEDIPELMDGNALKYDPYFPIFYKVYILVHFAIIILFHTQLMTTIHVLSQYKIYLTSVFIFASLTSFGFIMDNRKWAKIFEMFRCFAYVIIENIVINAFVNNTSYKLVLALKSIFFISILVIWFDIVFNFYELIYSRKKNK